MYDPALRQVVLARLARWGRLTESDLNAMLRPEQRVQLRSDLFEDLAWEGLVTLRVIGDEPVIAITDEGRAWLQQNAPEAAADAKRRPPEVGETSYGS
ncbi:MAG: hypothetical protein IT305_03535 [Chloroflexi bacterium]|nr:hypothetical protein [Chloroflexota bacterium]